MRFASSVAGASGNSTLLKTRVHTAKVEDAERLYRRVAGHHPIASRFERELLDGKAMLVVHAQDRLLNSHGVPILLRSRLHGSHTTGGFQFKRCSESYEEEPTLTSAQFANCILVMRPKIALAQKPLKVNVRLLIAIQTPLTCCLEAELALNSASLEFGFIRI